MSKLLERNANLKVPYVNFLMNPYQKILELNKILIDVDDPSGVIEMLLQEMGHTITHLTLGDSESYSETSVIRMLAFLPNLEVLFISGHNLYSNLLLFVVAEKCKSVSTLHLKAGSSRITDDGLKYLCTGRDGETYEENRTIRSLDLSETNVTTSGLAFALKYFPMLENFVHKNVALALYHVYRDFKIRNISMPVMTKLESLEIDFYQLTFLNEIHALGPKFEEDTTRAYAAMCPNLKQLSISAKHSVVLACSDFRHLEEISFKGAQNIGDLSPFLKSSGKNLRRLHVHCNAEVPLVYLLKTCPRLEAVYFFQVNFIDTPTSVSEYLPLVHLIKLSFFAIEENLKTLTNCRLLVSNCPNLKELTLTCCSGGVNNNVIPFILECECVRNSLECVRFMSTDITTDVLIRLAMVAVNLRYVEIHYCRRMSNDECMTMTRVFQENGMNSAVSYQV